MTCQSKSISVTCWIYLQKPLQIVLVYEDYHFRILMIFSYIYITRYLSTKLRLAINELTNGFSIKTWIALVLNRFHQCYVWNIFTWRCLDAIYHPPKYGLLQKCSRKGDIAIVFGQPIFKVPSRDTIIMHWKQNLIFNIFL